MKMIRVAPILCLLFLLTACGNDAESTLESYLKAYYGRDFDTAYALLSAQDQQRQTLTDYKAALADPVTVLILSRTLYKIENVETGDDAATAQVEINQPDTSGLVQYIGQLSLQLDPDGQLSPEERANKVVQELNKKMLPRAKTMVEFDLVKENSEWKVQLKGD